jgi:ketosteroid isomerase-like protein
MSEENVEIVRQAFAAFSREGPEASASFWDPEIGVGVPPELAQAGTYRGRDAVLEWISEWSDAWDRIEYTAEEILENGDSVVVTVFYDGVGRGSRIENRRPILVPVQAARRQDLLPPPFWRRSRGPRSRRVAGVGGTAYPVFLAQSHSGRSSTRPLPLATLPPAARYCAGDVGGERRGIQARI